MAESFPRSSRDIELRFTMRELLVLHGALRDKQVEHEKEGWHLGRRGQEAQASIENERAAEAAALAERLMSTVEGIMEWPKGDQ